MSSLFAKWHRKQKKIKYNLRQSYVSRILGDRLLDQHIWKIDKNSMAGGVSLGLFIAFTPTIPFQMLLAALGAILLRVNLPAALAACWITNPLTALPIYLTARRWGQHLLENAPFTEFILDFFSFESRTGQFMEQGLYVWTGTLMLSIVSAIVGNIAVRCVWNMSQRFTGKIHERPQPK